MSVVRLFALEGGKKRDPAVEKWFKAPPTELRSIARKWFEEMRACGPDDIDLLHDGHPTAYVADLAFGYVNAALRALIVSAYADMKERLAGR